MEFPSNQQSVSKQRPQNYILGKMLGLYVTFSTNCPSLCVLVCLSVSVCLCLSAIFLHACLSHSCRLISLSIHLSFCLSVCLSHS